MSKMSKQSSKNVINMNNRPKRLSSKKVLLKRGTLGESDVSVLDNII